MPNTIPRHVPRDLSTSIGAGRRIALAVLVGIAALAPRESIAQAATSAAIDAEARPDFRADLAAARAATERRDFNAALALFERLLLRSPGNADLLIEAARVFGWADRNAAAADLYRRAIVLAPARRANILPSLAWQTLWAGQVQAAQEAQGAMQLFEEWLRIAPNNDTRAEAWDGLAQSRGATGDTPGALAALREALALRPDDARLQRRLAQALLWSDQPDAAALAIASLRPLVEGNPQARELAWALANALNFDSRHREALTAFQRWPAPVQEGDRLDLARAWRWAGFEDRAMPLLQGASDAETLWLRDFRVAREVSAFGYAGLELAEDRDDLHSRAWVLGAGLRPIAGATLEFGSRRLSLEDAFGAPDATTFEVAGRMRFGEPDSPAGTLWPQVVLRQHHVTQASAWNPFTFAVRLKWVPADRWRLDAEQTRELIETPRAFANRVTVDVGSLGAAWRADARFALAGSLAQLRFDDGTTRQRFNARAEWALRARPRWVVGAEWSQFERTREGAAGADVRGYWNPRRYQEGRLVSGVTWELRPFELQARVGLASSREVDAAGNASRGSPHLWELAANLDASASWQLRASIGGSGQGLGLSGTGTSGAGYWRRWADLGLHGWF